MEQFETESIPLPSKGLLYDKTSPLSKGFIEMRYMTAKHEDILTNPNKLAKGLNYLINEFAKSLIVDKEIDYKDLVEGDSFQVILASRILSYGSKYEFSYKDKPYTINLAELPNKKIDTNLFQNVNEFEFMLPMRDIPVTIKLLTVGDFIKYDEEITLLKEKFPEDNFNRFVKLKYMIQSIDGNYDREFVEDFIENKLVGWDISAIFDYHKEISPDVDVSFKPEDDSTEGVKTIPFSYFELFFPERPIQVTVTAGDK
jgi:hypothetical protein